MVDCDMLQKKVWRLWWSADDYQWIMKRIHAFTGNNLKLDLTVSYEKKEMNKGFEW